MLVAVHSVQAQTQPGPWGVDAGVVANVVVTPSPTKVTVPINTAPTFTASATDGTPQCYPGWTVVSGATYLWSVAAPVTASPTDASQTTVGVPSSASAGTSTVSVTCSVIYICINEDGLYGTIAGSGSTTVPIYVIGGPISGTNDIHYYFDPGPLSSQDWGHLSAASGQPAGTTYSWSVTGKAQYIGDTLPPTTANVTYAGKGAGSTKIGDVTATVTYSLSGVSAVSPPFPITVHAPTQFIYKSVDQPTEYRGPDVYGFANQVLHFKVWDGVNQPVTNAYWDESWALVGNGNGFEPPHIGGPLDGTGSSVDIFTDTLFPVPTNAGVYPVSGPYMHSYWATDAGGGFAGGGIGSLIQVYPNVFYNRPLA